MFLTFDVFICVSVCIELEFQEAIGDQEINRRERQVAKGTENRVKESERTIVTERESTPNKG